MTADWKRKLLKYALLLLGAAVLLIVALAVTYAVNYYRDKPLSVTTAVEMTPGTDVTLGEPVSGRVELLAPWHLRPVTAEVVPGAGATLVNQPTIEKTARQWGNTVWEITFELKTYRTGEIPAGSLKIMLANDRADSSQPETITLELPALQSEPRPVAKGEALSLAGELAPETESSGISWRLPAAVIALIIVLALLVWLHFRRRQLTERILPPWELALEKLHSLRDYLHSRDADLSGGFGMLTDIVRNYLEQRFELPATRQTTGEFLQSMERSDSPLPAGQQYSLREFMLAADLVKFAKAAPDVQLLNQALDKAEQLVDATRPAPEAENPANGPEGGQA